MGDLLYGIEITLIGFPAVLLILLLLYFTLNIFSKTLAKTTNKKTAKAEAKAFHTAPKLNSKEEEPEIVAAIGAALSAYLELPSERFKIMSIQAQQNIIAANWAWAGRNKLMENRANLASWRREK